MQLLAGRLNFQAQMRFLPRCEAALRHLQCDAGPQWQPLPCPQGTGTTAASPGTLHRDGAAGMDTWQGKGQVWLEVQGAWTRHWHGPGALPSPAQCAAIPGHCLAAPLPLVCSSSQLAFLSCYCWNGHLKAQTLLSFWKLYQKIWLEMCFNACQQKPTLRCMGNRAGAIFTPLSKRK